MAEPASPGATGTATSWVPGVRSMLAFTVLMFLAPNLAQMARLLPFEGGPSGPPMPYVALLLVPMVVFAVLAHRSYVRARTANAATPGLRGAWFIENAWWAVYLGLFAAGAIVVLVVVAFA